MSAGVALAALSEGCMVASGLSVGAGWIRIRQRRLRAHRRWMLTAATLGATFFILYVTHTLAVGDTSFGGPAGWRVPYQTFLQAHSILATVAGVMGVITLRRALRRRFSLHRRIAPWTATLWLVAAGSGLVVFLLLYVVFPPGPTANLLRTMLRP